MKLSYLLIFGLLLGCSQPSDDYFPLGEQMIWEYQITKELGNNLNKGKSIIAQLSSITSGDIQYFPHRYANGQTLYYSQAEAGIQRSSKMEKNGSVFLKKPFDLDTGWMRETKIELLDSRHESFSGGESFISQGEKIFLDSKIISFDETINVPAGVFKKTMRIDGNASVAVIERTRGIDQILIKQTEWYAKGIGLVKRRRYEISVPEKYNAKQVTELIRFERN